MKSVVAILVIVLMTFAGCTKRQGSDIRSGTLAVQVTESYLPLVQVIVDDYRSIYPDVTITLSGVTTRGAIVDLINDSVHCIITDRPFNDEEQEAVKRAELHVEETEIARDGLAILVHQQNKLAALSQEELGSIFSGATTLWSKVPGSHLRGAIELCLTGRNSGLYELLTRNFFHMKNDAPLAAIAPSQAGILEYVATHPEALGVVSYAAWKDTTRTGEQQWKRNVRVLPMTGKNAEGVSAAVPVNQRNIYDRIYPLTFSLYIYASEKTPGTAKGFSAFVAGEYGQREFLYAGLVPKTMPYRTIQLTQE